MIKGKYVALVEVDVHIKEGKGMRPFEEIKEDLISGEVTEELAKKLKDMFSEDEDASTVKVTQQYADLYEVENDADD